MVHEVRYQHCVHKGIDIIKDEPWEFSRLLSIKLAIDICFLCCRWYAQGASKAKQSNVK